jgi:hypothetical protein
MSGTHSHILNMEEQQKLSSVGQASYVLFLCLNRAQPIIAARHLTDALVEHRALLKTQLAQAPD